MEPREPSWRPTPAYVRSLVVAGAALIAAVALHRLDLLVLGLPFALVAGWSAYRRPRRAPALRTHLGQRTLREGEATRWSMELSREDGLEDVVGLIEPSEWGQLQPMRGVAVAAVEDAPEGPAPVAVGLDWRSLRWGHHEVGPSLVAGVGPWGAYRWGPREQSAERVTVLPVPAVFDTSAPAPHPQGLVGVNRAARPGEGSEFAGIRPFQLGDRLRRIHWAVSQRTGALHVTSSYADQDSHVVIIVDAVSDLGTSEGIDGRASSLDVSVRAAGAVAEHYLRRGERVSLRVLGAADVARVPPAAGRGHLRRVLATLATISPGTDLREDERAGALGIGAGALVVMLSPLVAPIALGQAVTLARRGLTVVVIDTLPGDVALPPDPDGTGRLAWRLRMLEREGEVRRVQAAGVPVVAWRGPGSLDQVLRELGRRASAPRVAHR